MKTYASETLVQDDEVRERIVLNHNETLVQDDEVRERIVLNHNETLVASAG